MSSRLSRWVCSLLFLFALLMYATHLLAPGPHHATKHVAKPPISSLENIHWKTKPNAGYRVEVFAEKAELARKFVCGFSFVGQYAIRVQNVEMRYDLSTPDLQTLKKLGKEMSRHIEVYPKQWGNIADATYKNISVIFLSQQQKVLSFKCKKAIKAGKGLLFTDITNASDPRLAHMGIFNTALPSFASFIFDNTLQSRDGNT